MKAKNQKQMKINRRMRFETHLQHKDLLELGVLTVDQARFMRQASHYWLDKEDGKLYRKNAGKGNPQLVIGIPERM